MTGILYHNPRCSKSRQTLELLREKGLQPEIVEYLGTPISKAALVDILSMLNMPASELIRNSESIYKELGLSKEDTEERLINAMMEHPKLIQRPIYINKGKAAIGRPPENVLNIL